MAKETHFLCTIRLQCIHCDSELHIHVYWVNPFEVFNQMTDRLLKFFHFLSNLYLISLLIIP